VLRKRKFLIGGIIVFLAIGYLAYVGFMGSATYYYTVSELKGLGNAIHGDSVRVTGTVVPGSVEQETGKLNLRFTIAEGEESLPVSYRGAVPDAFTVGNEVVVDGNLNSSGVFQANTILVKCPSRYVPKK